MAKIEKPTKKDSISDYFSDEKRIYTDVELAQFDKELEPYRITKTLTYPVPGETISYVDEIRFLREFCFIDSLGNEVKGLVSADGSPRFGRFVDGYDEHKTNRCGEEYTYPGTAQPYLVMRNKLDQWRAWRGRQDFARIKANEQLDQIYQAKDALPFGSF